MFLTSLGLLPFFGPTDPAPGSRPRSWSRNLVCERLTPETASREFPGQVIEAKPRGDFVERSALVCRERLTRPGLRTPRDEAILETLDTAVRDLALDVTSLHPDLEERTWLVEVNYPSALVSAKISFAAKNALMMHGASVSDRTPVLSAGDVDVLTRMGPDEAYPAACRRYAETGSLREGDALLAVVIRDLRETTLHGGLCTEGTWTWLR